MANLLVYPENMTKNLEKTHGLIFSQRVLLALVEDHGLSREKSYEIVQRNAMQCWQTGADFRQLLLADPEVAAIMSEDEIDKIFDYGYHLKHVDDVYKRFDL